MKKSIALVLAILLTFGMTTVAFAAAPKITGIKQPIAFNANPSDYDVGPKTVWDFPLTADMFEWSDGVAGAVKGVVTTAQLTAANIEIKSSSRDMSMIKSIAFVNKASSLNTACLRIQFLDEYVGVDEKDFKISLYLTLKKTRIPTTELILEGVFANPLAPVPDADADYVYIGDGRVLKPKAYMKKVDVDLGSGILIQSRLYADKKYYGTAKEDITSADERILSKFPSIDSIYTLKTVGLKANGNIVKFDFDGNFYVYGLDGKYLGRSNDLVAYSDRYYLSTKSIDMGGGITSSASTSSSSSSSQSSSSSNTPTATGAAITIATATAQTEVAIKTAKTSGAKTASVRVKDAASISPAALQAMVKTAARSNMGVTLLADTMDGKSVVGRLTINPASAANLKSDIKLGAYVDNAHVGDTQTKFAKWYQNKIVVISLAHKGSYGLSLEVAASVKLTGLNTKSLYFYSYDKSTNKYAIIQKPSSYIDTNGYLHFTTSQAGEIIITDSPLKKK